MRPPPPGTTCPLDGRPWRAGSKTRDALIRDYCDLHPAVVEPAAHGSEPHADTAGAAGPAPPPAPAAPRTSTPTASPSRIPHSPHHNTPSPSPSSRAAPGALPASRLHRRTNSASNSPRGPPGQQQQQQQQGACSPSPRHHHPGTSPGGRDYRAAVLHPPTYSPSSGLSPSTTASTQRTSPATASGTRYSQTFTLRPPTGSSPAGGLSSSQQLLTPRERGLLGTRGAGDPDGLASSCTPGDTAGSGSNLFKSQGGGADEQGQDGALTPLSRMYIQVRRGGGGAEQGQNEALVSPPPSPDHDPPPYPPPPTRLFIPPPRAPLSPPHTLPASLSLPPPYTPFYAPPHPASLSPPHTHTLILHPPTHPSGLQRLASMGITLLRAKLPPPPPLQKAREARERTALLRHTVTKGAASGVEAHAGGIAMAADTGYYSSQASVARAGLCVPPLPLSSLMPSSGGPPAFSASCGPPPPSPDHDPLGHARSNSLDGADGRQARHSIHAPCTQLHAPAA